MFVTIRKWTAIYVTCLILLFCLFAAIMKYGEIVPASVEVGEVYEHPVLIIDAGHGGEDGGAVGIDGTIESSINLSVALKCAEIARLIGWDIRMTRTEDISIHDHEADTLREKKISDLKNRVAICNEFENSFLLSIHQNSMPSAKSIRGAQAFYYDTEEGMEQAVILQNSLNRHLNSGANKTAKHIGESSYLMKNVTCPAVLVECGFLSNPNDCKLLNTKDHQLRISIVVIAAISNSLRN